MAEIIKSVLITNWSSQHVAGFDLDGGTAVSYDLDPDVVGGEAAGHDEVARLPDDIATLRIDPETNLARLRIVTPKAAILRLRICQIFEIAHTNGKSENGRHIFLKGTTHNGSVYILPMLGYTVWSEAWDFTALQTAMQDANSHDPASRLSCTAERYDLKGAERQELVELFNDIFYPSSKNTGTVFDHAESLSLTTTTVQQAGPSPRMDIYVAAFIKKLKSDLTEPDDDSSKKRGTAFSPPYFMIGGKKLFIRTNPAL